MVVSHKMCQRNPQRSFDKNDRLHDPCCLSGAIVALFSFQVTSDRQVTVNRDSAKIFCSNQSRSGLYDPISPKIQIFKVQRSMLEPEKYLQK